MARITMNDNVRIFKLLNKEHYSNCMSILDCFNHTEKTLIINYICDLYTEVHGTISNVNPESVIEACKSARIGTTWYDTDIRNLGYKYALYTRTIDKEHKEDMLSMEEWLKEQGHLYYMDYKNQRCFFQYV